MGSILLVGKREDVIKITSSLPFMAGLYPHSFVKTVEKLSPELARGMAAVVFVNTPWQYLIAKFFGGKNIPPVYYIDRKSAQAEVCTMCTTLNSL